MKIMVTGANGFLAQHLCAFLSKKGFEVLAVSRGMSRTTADYHYTNLELTDVSSVSAYVATMQPEVIIHVAAMSKPDECNADQPECIRQNVTVTETLALAASKIRSHFIYCSTDFIFGENGPHAEEDPADPLNFYGRSKLMAEEIVKKEMACYTIIRPVFIYGLQHEGMRPGFIQWVQQSLRAGKSIKVVSDQLRTPTYAQDICWGIEQIIRFKKTGVYHLAGNDIISPFEMAITVAEVLGLDASLIQEVNSDSFPEPVRRAKKSGLKINKAMLELNYKPHSFKEGVRKSFIE
jgi:dTDP-4-dehydrorhamnose reductase